MPVHENGKYHLGFTGRNYMYMYASFIILILHSHHLEKHEFELVMQLNSFYIHDHTILMTIPPVD